MPAPLNVYDHPQVAERYHRKGGFAPRRKQRMLEVVLDQLMALTPRGAALLELGAGTGLLTQKLVASGHFGSIHVTDGAPAMLELAKGELSGQDSSLDFDIVRFSAAWPESVLAKRFDAVTSTMAIHHAEDKLQLFQQVFGVLKPGGVFVNGDHVVGASPTGQYLIGRERALERLGREECVEPGRVAELVRVDERKQEAEGNRCESVARYEFLLSSCGFQDVECLWQDYWLAVLVALKPVA